MRVYRTNARCNLFSNCRTNLKFLLWGLGKCSGVDDIFAKMAHFTTKMLIFLHNWTEKSITRIKSHVLKNFPQSQPRTVLRLAAQPQNARGLLGLMARPLYGICNTNPLYKKFSSISVDKSTPISEDISRQIARDRRYCMLQILL